jgi:GNAT superfamily N-acetyltransferase
MITLRAISADDWPAWRELRLEALREAPSAFGSTLAQWQGEGDTEARWRARLNDVPFNAIAEFDGMAAGIASGTALSADGTVELISMWVAPFARGRGAGDALIGAIVHWARAQRANRVALAVVPQNPHAIALYARHGFVRNGMAGGELTMVLPLTNRSSAASRDTRT